MLVGAREVEAAARTATRLAHEFQRREELRGREQDDAEPHGGQKEQARPKRVLPGSAALVPAEDHREPCDREQGNEEGDLKVPGERGQGEDRGQEEADAGRERSRVAVGEQQRPRHPGDAKQNVRVGKVSEDESAAGHGDRRQQRRRSRAVEGARIGVHASGQKDAVREIRDGHRRFRGEEAEEKNGRVPKTNLGRGESGEPEGALRVPDRQRAGAQGAAVKIFERQKDVAEVAGQQKANQEVRGKQHQRPEEGEREGKPPRTQEAHGE